MYKMAFADIYGSSLLGWWTLDSNNITNNIVDSSGNGNTGHLVGDTSTTTAAGYMGQALSFGTNGQVYVPTITLTSATKSTVSFWIKPASTINSGSGEKDVMWINDTTPLTTEYFSVFWNGSGGADGKLQFDQKLAALGDQTTETTKSSWTGGIWYFITFTWGSSGAIVYVNGVQNNAAAGNTRSLNNMTFVGAANLTFAQGHFNGGNGSGFISVMDDVRIYNRNLSAAEVNTLYYQGIGNHGQ